MRKNIKALILCLGITISCSSLAFAEGVQDVVTGAGKQPIRSEKFGNCVQTKWSSPSSPCAAAPAPQAEVAPAPVAAPEPAPAPEPVAQLVSEQLTILFDFNKSIITPTSAAKLDQIAAAVNLSPHVTKVNIVGYTDQIGTDKYNDKLSVRRAHSVKAYLDGKMRIDANVLGLRGLGKQSPVDECKNSKNRKAKIACMAVNRRVEVEFEFQK